MAEELFNLLRRRLYTLWLEQNESIKKQKAKLNKRIEKLEDEKTDLMRKDFSETDERKRENLSVVMEKVDDELEQIENERTELKEKHEENFERAWASLQVLRDLSEVLTPDGEFEPKKRILLALISNLVFYEDRVELIWKEPFDVLVKPRIDDDDEKGSKSGSTEQSSFGSPFWSQCARTF